MPAQTPPNPKASDPVDAEAEEAVAVMEPFEEEDVWERYNKRMEFPLAAVAAVFFHVVVFAVLIFVLVGLMGGEDRSGPELKLMRVGGLDDTGEGSAGSGGQENPEREADVNPATAAEKAFPTPEALNEAKADLSKLVLEDPNGKLPISAQAAEAFKDIDKSIAEKLLGIGGKKGSGPGAGSGDDGTPGKGPGGTGADSTRARGLRWVLRFKIAGGSDYVDQLKAMGAEVLIPLTSDRDCILIPDLGNPAAQKVANDTDFRRLASKIQFSDNRPAQVRDVLGTLGVKAPGNPKAFWAFFPKDLEDELSRMETNYLNRRAEEIEETIFQVTAVRGEKPKIKVVDQVRKK